MVVVVAVNVAAVVKVSVVVIVVVTVVVTVMVAVVVEVMVGVTAVKGYLGPAGEGLVRLGGKISRSGM
jgi:hypothetical protein